MENVLIVDDDEGFLLSLRDMLNSSKQSFSILTAHNGLEAMDILNSKAVNLIVTDLKMPEMDGFDLLAKISSSHPDIPVIVMTAYGTPEMESRLKIMGAFQYIEKPIDFNILLSKISDGLAACSKGHIDGISLPSFMQLLQLDKKTCTLTITSRSQTGILYFQGGELTNASWMDQIGLDAAMEIASWDNTRIEIINICKLQERNIDVPLGYILIESARMKDEREGELVSEEEDQNSFESSQETPLESTIDGLNLDNLDFDAPNPVEAFSEEDLVKALENDEETATGTSTADQTPNTSTSQQLQDQDKSDLDILIDAAETINGVTKMIVIAKDGKVLAKKDIEVKKFGNFVAYATAAAQQMGKNMEFTGPHSIVMNQVSGEKLVILPGPHVTVGLQISENLSPAEIVTGLQKAVLRAKTP